MSGQWKLAVLGLVVGLVTLGGCLKDGDNGVYQVSAVRALNAVPGAGQLDIGLNESWLNYDLQTNEVEDFGYRDTLPYKKAWPGTRTVGVFEREDTTVGSPLVQRSVQFNPGVFYSLYVIGTTDDMELMVTEDDLSAPAAGQAKIRFMNLSPDAPALDFGATESDTLIADNLAFKEVQDFVEVDGGEMYTFIVSRHRGGGAVHSFEFKPESDRIYTIWVRGLFADTGNSDLGFGHDILVH